MKNLPFVDTMSSSRRRSWILLTAIAATLVFSWSSISGLNELVELQQLPDDPPIILSETKSNEIVNNLSTNKGSSLDTSRKSKSEIANDASLNTSRTKFLTKVTTTTSSTGSIDQDEIDTVANIPDDATQRGTTGTNIGGVKQKSGSVGGGGGGGGGITKPTVTSPLNRVKQTTPAGTASKGTTCKASVILPNTDFWGEALVPGYDNRPDTAEECCKLCAEYEQKGIPEEDAVDCNLWVYCEDKELCGSTYYKQCWLKHLAHPDGTAPTKQGPDVGWTTGLMQPRGIRVEENGDIVDPTDDRKYHIVITAQGPATHWQSRVHYYWYKKTLKKCEAAGNCHMGGWTRILHSGEEDDLMEEMPTFVAQQLPPEHPSHGYIVLNRPWAFVQWLKEAKIKEKYVLMSEPDHVWLKPMPNLMVGQHAAAFPFFYIEPSKKEYLPIVQKFVGQISRKESEQMAPIGNAPTMMSYSDLQRVVPIWFNLSIAIHNDKQAAKEWGWVQEMYAFSLAAYKAGLRDIGLHIKLMSQPPFDTTLDPYYILHYTYGMDYTLDGVFTPGKYGEWRFDKRSYSQKPPPRNLGEPPEKMGNELVRHLIHAINEATNAIPGWDEYVKTGVAKEIWDGVIRG
ncbi:hypothetical protein Ndes2526A_g00413 [Nannochloris sp. 'desiccata']